MKLSKATIFGIGNPLIDVVINVEDNDLKNLGVGHWRPGLWRAPRCRCARSRGPSGGDSRAGLGLPLGRPARFGGRVGPASRGTPIRRNERSGVCGCFGRRSLRKGKF